MDDVTVTRAGLTALIAVITYLSGQFGDLFWLLCLLMLMDYATGYISAWITKTRNSRIGLLGIIKKLMYIMSVVFGFILDMTLISILERLDIEFMTNIVNNVSIGIILIVFYIGNESISIVENFEKMGIKLPKWFKKLGRLIKDTPNIVIDEFIKNGEKYLDDQNKKNDPKLGKRRTRK